MGVFALSNNTSGGDNTAVGKGSLLMNTVGFANVVLERRIREHNRLS